jgi:hypothetical protein
MKRNWLILWIVGFLGLQCSVDLAYSATSEVDGRSREGRRVWIDREWEVRYFVEVFDKELWARMKKDPLADGQNGKSRSFARESYFEPASIVDLKASSPLHSNQLAVFVIEFDREGWVTTPHGFPGRLRGRLSRAMTLELTSGDMRSDPSSILAAWFTGLGDVSTHWAPAFCRAGQYPVPPGFPIDTYLYGPKIKLDQYSSSGFGCREWAYQLYDDERPFIDVTSYLPGRGGRITHPHLLDVYGWARFGDRKPIIGKQGDYWYCLHDCPNGERPGMIDIKAWTARNGWPLPKPPTRVPTFPDPPAKQGTYPK